MKNLIKYCIGTYLFVGKSFAVTIGLITTVVIYMVLIVLPMVMALDYKMYWAFILYLATIPLASLLTDFISKLMNKGIIYKIVK